LDFLGRSWTFDFKETERNEEDYHFQGCPIGLKIKQPQLIQFKNELLPQRFRFRLALRLFDSSYRFNMAPEAFTWIRQRALDKRELFVPLPLNPEQLGRFTKFQRWELQYLPSLTSNQSNAEVLLKKS